jgi:RNA polymerase sigma-70 factor (family 1)
MQSSPQKEQLHSEDKELIILFNNPEQKNYAFNQLVVKYQKKVYWHIRRIVIDHDDADDIVQDVFIKAWENLSSFRQESNIFTWLYRIATNECINFLNKKKRRSLIPFADVEYQLSKSLESDVYYNGNEIQKKLQNAILKLPEKQRIVFNMKYYDELKYEEMAEILDTSVGALKASFHHAVKKIEEEITKD